MTFLANASKVDDGECGKIVMLLLFQAITDSQNICPYNPPLIVFFLNIERPPIVNHRHLQ